MLYRSLGRTGLKVSAVSVGCMMFGWRADQAEVDKIVATAVDAGVNLFDTSVSYGRGASEMALGQALTCLGARDDLLIATKVGLASETKPGPNGLGNSRFNIIRQCELSLRRLRVDHIDLLQIHRPSTDIPIDETMSALNQLIRDGKVRYVGTSNFASWQIAECLWRCDKGQLLSTSSEQLRYNMLDRSAESEIFKVAERYGLGILAYSPLAEGLLTGKYRPNVKFPADSRFATASGNRDFAGLLTSEVSRVVDGLLFEAKKFGHSPATLATAWILRNKCISSVLVGPSRQDHLATLIKAADVNLGPELVTALESLTRPGHSLLPAI